MSADDEELNHTEIIKSRDAVNLHGYSRERAALIGEELRRRR